MSRREIYEKFRSDNGFTIGGVPILEPKETIKCGDLSESSEDEHEAYLRIVRKQPKAKKVREFYQKKVDRLNEEDQENKPYLNVFAKKDFIEPKKHNRRR